METAPLMYTAQEFRDLARISRTAFWRLQKRGEGPTLIRIGTRCYVSRDAASVWIKEREASSVHKAS